MFYVLSGRTVTFMSGVCGLVRGFLLQKSRAILGLLARSMAGAVAYEWLDLLLDGGTRIIYLTLCIVTLKAVGNRL